MSRGAALEGSPSAIVQQLCCARESGRRRRSQPICHSQHSPRSRNLLTALSHPCHFYAV